MFPGGVKTDISAAARAPGQPAQANRRFERRALTTPDGAARWLQRAFRPQPAPVPTPLVPAN